MASTGDQRPPIPARPDGSRPGGPAPWAGLELSARRGLSTGLLLDRLTESGQGGRPPPLEQWAGPAALRLRGRESQAAVLIAAFDDGGEIRVVLTRRSTRLRNHRGQVSFPGGRIEPGEGVWDAARRESAEEVGIDPGAPQPVGWLHPVVTRSSESLVLPVVGILPGRPRLEANPHEVARAFDVALADLAGDGAFREEWWQMPALEGAAEHGTYPVHFFDVAGETIWGATARILVELLQVVLGLTRARRSPGGAASA